jgi:hypothetical protein
VRAPAALAALVAALALAAAGCGGGDEPSGDSAVAWAEGFCGAVQEWTGELGAVGDTLGDPASLTLDRLREAAESVRDATDAFVADVRALGRPETESAEEVESAIEKLADSLESERAKIEAALEDAEGLSGALAAAGTIGTALSGLAELFQTTFEELESAKVGGELERAFQQAEACEQISAAS